MKTPELTPVAGNRSELEKKAVQMIFTPGNIDNEWGQLINRLSHRAKLTLVKGQDER